MQHLLDSPRLTIPETARRLDVHVATVWRWITRGVGGRRLAAVKIGGRRYVREVDLIAFVEGDGAAPVRPEQVAAVSRAEAAGRQLDESIG